MDLVTVEFLSQACMALRAGDIEIVSDPWFLRTAHLNSWIPYPSWDARELENFRSRIDRATHIYLSHDHEDHFDPAFLETLSRKTILVGAFRNSAFRHDLEALGDRHDIRYLHHAREMFLSKEVSVHIFMEQPDFRLNSMMVIRTPHGTVLNANDCGLNRMILSSIGRRFPVTLFMYTLNFLANGYPFPYLRRSDADLDSKVAAVRNDVLDTFRLALGILKPKLSAAFAGPVTFADRINDHLNNHRNRGTGAAWWSSWLRTGRSSGRRRARCWNYGATTSNAPLSRSGAHFSADRPWRGPQPRRSTPQRT